jgi:hypothetical protein
MSTYDNKVLKDVSDAVSKIMNEQLKGDQHKIDANKNNKIDSHDFKMLRAGKKVAKEEVDQVEEGIEDKIEAAKAKAKAAGKTMKAPAAAEKSKTTMVAGKAYGGAAQKDEPEDDEDDTMKSSKKGSFKRRYNTKMYKEEFSGLLNSYIDGGLKSLMENLEIVEEVIEEEPDNATFTKELEAQKAKDRGEGKKAEVAKASVQAVKNEEVEQVDVMEKSYDDTLAVKGYAGTQTHNPTWDTHTSSREWKKAHPKLYKQKIKDTKTAIKGRIDRGDYNKKPKLPEQVEERTLTSSEMETREKNVKGMKKKLSGFKERYGSRAKEVIYATATQMAKKDQ